MILPSNATGSTSAEAAAKAFSRLWLEPFSPLALTANGDTLRGVRGTVLNQCLTPEMLVRHCARWLSAALPSHSRSSRRVRCPRLFYYALSFHAIYSVPAPACCLQLCRLPATLLTRRCC